MIVPGRNLDDYTAQYKALPFEPIQTGYRRNIVTRELLKSQPRHFLEIGCGEAPLFVDFPDIASTVIEPTPAFALNARAMRGIRKDVDVHECLLENYREDHAPFDMVIASCVLHEVPDTHAFLASLRRLCDPHTLVHINVPNARSLHRILAVSMGLISSPFETSATQKTMQQRAIPYDMESLRQEMELAGFAVVDQGGIFVKPFTHGQMQNLVDSGFMSEAMLNGLGVLAEALPELSSEIWINARISQ
jgi:ubiquinone/menaquinone biosynthesis C-methylase UbiE